MGGAPPSQSADAGTESARIVPVDFPSLYREQFAYAWRTLRRLGVLPRDLPDVVHDLFVVVFRQMHLYDRSRPIKPWLFGIAFRVVSDYRRSARFSRELLDAAPDVTDQAPGADEQVADTQARAQVMKVLAGLDLDLRAIFVMHDLEGQPIPAIAEALAIPEPTAYSRLRRAREDVTAAIKRLRAREEGFRP